MRHDGGGGTSSCLEPLAVSMAGSGRPTLVWLGPNGFGTLVHRWRGSEGGRDPPVRTDKKRGRNDPCFNIIYIYL
jgi:hypothetical protein